MRHVPGGEARDLLAAGARSGDRHQRDEPRAHQRAQAQIQPDEPRGHGSCRSSACTSSTETFDLIICTGVLHHLADPDAGLRALRSVLKSEGVMHLMVYAPYGRTGVYMLQEYCRRLGIGTSPRDIEDLSRALQLLPRHHPLTALVADSKDFAKADALADTLLNPRDRAYSVPQLFEFIEDAGLEFRRWFRQAPVPAAVRSPGRLAAQGQVNRARSTRSVRRGGTVARFDGSTQSNRWSEGDRARLAGDPI